MDAAAGEAAYADAQKSSDKQDLDPADFEDDGKDEFKGLDKKEKKKVKKTKREKEEAKHAGGVLGMFAVRRVCLRGHRYDIDAFMRKTKTTEKDVTSNIIKMGMLEVFDGRGKKDKKGNYPGLYLDDVIYGVEFKLLRRFLLIASSSTPSTRRLARGCTRRTG